MRRLVCLFVLIASSCVSSQHINQWSGPQQKAFVASQPWSFDGTAGQTLQTAHYLIHTTIGDYAFVDKFAQVMEGAYAQYRKLVPGVAPRGGPMECFVFADRPQWRRFTQMHTGPRAAIYLKIERGAYTIGDWYVSYYLGDLNSFSIASHEGFHQFLGRNFSGHLPPFLEEGTACMFENVRMRDGRPEWNLSANLHRAQSLRKAEEGGYAFPLSKLIQMNAGDVVDDRGQQIEAFYAQSWAFAEFLYFADQGKYRPAFEKLLSDTARGATHSSSVALLLESYLHMPLSRIDGLYEAFVHDLAFTHFERQWGS